MAIWPFRVMLPSAPRTTVTGPDAWASAMSLSMILNFASASSKLEPEPSRRPMRPSPVTVPPVPSLAAKVSIRAVVSSNRLASVRPFRRRPVALSRKAPSLTSSRPLMRGSAMVPAMVALPLT
jgi:hypothetical protein